MDIDKIAVILGLILAVPLWLLYHKVFTVYYRDAFYGIMAELLGAVFTGYIIARLLLFLLGKLAAFVTSILVTVVTYGVIALAALAVIWAVLFLLFLRRQRLNPFQKVDIPSLEEKPTRASCNGFLAFTYWKAAAFIYHNRLFVTLVMIILGVVVAISVMTRLTARTETQTPAVPAPSAAVTTLPY